MDIFKKFKPSHFFGSVDVRGDLSYGSGLVSCTTNKKQCTSKDNSLFNLDHTGEFKKREKRERGLEKSKCRP